MQVRSSRQPTAHHHLAQGRPTGDPNGFFKFNNTIMCVYVYIVFIHIYIHVFTCVYMCIHVFTCVYMCLHVFTCVYMCIHVYTCVTRVYMCIHVYTCAYMCIHVFTSVYMCAPGDDCSNGPELPPCAPPGRPPLLPQSSEGQAGGRPGHLLVQVQDTPIFLEIPNCTFHFRASNVDGSVTSRKANLDIAVLRGEFPEEPLDTWVAQRGEVSRVLRIWVFTGFSVFLYLGFHRVLRV